jgi:soluble lytic murein transglycosylase-like protein
LCLLLLLAIGLASHAFKRAATVEEQLNETVLEMQASMQELSAAVNFDSVRRQLLLGMRDEILRVNSNVSLSEAFHYAELLIDVTDKYPSVDPVLLLSIGIVESGLDTRARSPADARGLYQIWPSTGRMLAVMLGWEYTDEMLYDPVCNTEMAALYLDILMTTYNDLGMALAEYNGGPINAGYYRAGSRRTASETRDYIPKVLSNYERLAKKLPMAPGRSYDILYREPSRDGKQLGVTKQKGALRQAE